MKKLFALLLLSIICVSFIGTHKTYAVEIEMPGIYVPDDSVETPSTGSDGYVWPIDVNTARSQYTSDFYDAHPAIDIAASTGTQVVAAKGGTVFCASTASASASHKCSRCGFIGAGYHVVIKQTDGKYAMYAHLSSVSISTGASIATGKKIGAVGSTGVSTGAHLHFGIYNPNSDGSINYYSYTEPLKVLTPFCNVYADNITETSAILHGQFGAISVPFASAGIYFGTTTTNMKKITDSEAYGFEYAGNNIESLFFETSKYCGQLQKSVTYYYQIWIVNSGKEYKSDIFSFTTKGCEHSYDNACDTSCNVCGYTRTVSHSYQTTWSKDGSKHWHACSICGAKKDEASHTPGAAATETTAQTCTTCGYVIKAALGHIHSYGSTWEKDINGHWHECSCGARKDEGTHTYDSGKVTKDPTVDEEGVKTYTCTSCGTTKTEAITTLPPATTENQTTPENTTAPDTNTTTDDTTAGSDTTEPSVTIPTTTDSKIGSGKKNNTITVFINIAVAAVLCGAGIASAVFTLIIKKRR